MSFTPISNTPPQYEENGIAASGYYIKFYESGTTTPTAMATDSTGATLLDKCQLNTEGYPINGSGAVFIPHINVEYKIALFRNAADANANDLNNAAWDVDGLFPLITEGSGEVVNVSGLRLLTPLFNGQQVELLGHTLAGIGGGTFYYDANDVTSADNNFTVFTTANGARWVRSKKEIYSTDDLGMVADGIVDNTVDIISACLALKNTRSMFVVRGTVSISSQITIEGFNLRIPSISSVRVFGANASAFDSGAIVIKSGATLSGSGDIYTSGVLTPSAGSHTVRQDDGEVSGNITVYSQLDEAYVHYKGNCKISIVGGVTRGFRSRLNTDEPVSLDVEYFNVGIRYSDRDIMTPIVLPSDSRAMHIIPSIQINSLVSVNVIGNYSWNNGAWLGYAGILSDNLVDLKNLMVSGNTENAGYYLDENDAVQVGAGSGTCWEIEASPEAVFNGSSKNPAGYNVAIHNGSHDTLVNGVHYGAGGDPGVSITSSNNCIVSATIIGATNAVSIGEDQFTCTGTLVTSSTLKDSTFAPIRLGDTSDVTISNCEVVGAPTASQQTGGWAGLGRIYPIVLVSVKDPNDASYTNKVNNIRLVNNTYTGGFNREVMQDGLLTSGELRVVSKDNTYNCPMIPREIAGSAANISDLMTLDNDGDTQFIRATTATTTGGYSKTGTLTLGTPNYYLIEDLNPQLNDLTRLIGEGEDLESALSAYSLLFYVEYKTGMPRDRSSFISVGLSSEFNSSRTAQTFFSVFDDYEAIIGRTLVDGEYIPISTPLHEVIHVNADTANLLYLIISARDSVDYTPDIILTQPVITFGRN